MLEVIKARPTELSSSHQSSQVTKVPFLMAPDPGIAEVEQAYFFSPSQAQAMK